MLSIIVRHSNKLRLSVTTDSLCFFFELLPKSSYSFNHILWYFVPYTFHHCTSTYSTFHSHNILFYSTSFTLHSPSITTSILFLPIPPFPSYCTTFHTFHPIPISFFHYLYICTYFLHSTHSSLPPLTSFHFFLHLSTTTFTPPTNTPFHSPHVLPFPYNSPHFLSTFLSSLHHYLNLLP